MTPAYLPTLLLLFLGISTENTNAFSTIALPAAASSAVLSGQVIGDESAKYLLCENPKESTSGKSFIYEAYRQDANSGAPIGDPLVVKITSNTEALEREVQNFKRIDEEGKIFVQVLDHFPTAGVDEFQDRSALVMEKGSQDLRSFVQENGALKGSQLQEAAATAAECVQTVHSSNMVWTELKADNFIVQEDGDVIKGIDLESAVPHKDIPIEYTPEAVPPEFALAFLCGKEPNMEMDYNFDLWSLGMLLYEMSVGEPYFGKEECKVKIATELRNMEEVSLGDEDIDPRMKDLIGKCLQVDPKKRPSASQVMQHPFFG